MTKDTIVYVSKEFNPNPKYQPQFKTWEEAKDYLFNAENKNKNKTLEVLDSPTAYSETFVLKLPSRHIIPRT